MASSTNIYSEARRLRAFAQHIMNATDKGDSRYSYARMIVNGASRISRKAKRIKQESQ